VHGPAAAFNVYKVALPHYSTIFFFHLFSTLPSLSHLVSHYALSPHLAWTHPEPSIGLAAGEVFEAITLDLSL
jgi:hypothetical protein